jgi:hypothetical protein
MPLPWCAWALLTKSLQQDCDVCTAYAGLLACCSISFLKYAFAPSKDGWRMRSLLPWFFLGLELTAKSLMPSPFSPFEFSLALRNPLFS